MSQENKQLAIIIEFHSGSIKDLESSRWAVAKQLGKSER